MRVLVCGSRSWHDRERLYAVLDAFHANTDPIEVVIEGGARGADRLAYVITGDGSDNQPAGLVPAAARTT